MENFSSFKDAISTKLRTLEKKISVAYRSSTDPDKRYELRQHLITLDGLFRKIEDGSIEWDDLLKLGISKKSILEIVQSDIQAAAPTVEDFQKISKIPHFDFLDEDVYLSSKINDLFSIIEYININYQTIFAQKILLSASKTNSIREVFYNQYQDIFRIFNSYKNLATIPSKSDDFTKMLNKEYFQLLKTINTFLVSINDYMELIAADDTFSGEDFQESIVTEDVTSCISESTLKDALEECYSFVEEAISYIQEENREIFDSISIDQKLNSKK